MRLGPFYGMAWRKRGGWTCAGIWFRIYGYGLHVSTRPRSDAMSSERNGFKRALYVFGLRFEVLTK